MSFSAELKKELCALQTDPCCAFAECYALMLFGRRFDVNEITLQTESGTVAQTAAVLLATQTGVIAEVRTPLTQRGHGKVSTVTVDAGQRAQVLECFGHSANDVRRTANFANMQNECCAMAFLRGAFLACGTVNDPTRGYHLEFDTPGRRLADALELLLNQLMALHPGRTERKGTQVIYLKSGEDIAALLESLGAPQSAEQVRQVRLMKERRNDANRRTNFDAANIDKTVSAAATQIEAILRVKNSPEWGLLSDGLRELAEVRLAHPEYSLRELGEALAVPVSRSGVNHRLAKLMELAQQPDTPSDNG